MTGPIPSCLKTDGGRKHKEKRDRKEKMCYTVWQVSNSARHTNFLRSFPLKILNMDRKAALLEAD